MINFSRKDSDSVTRYQDIDSISTDDDDKSRFGNNKEKTISIRKQGCIIKHVDGYLVTNSINRKFFVKVRLLQLQNVA